MDESRGRREKDEKDPKSKAKTERVFAKVLSNIKCKFHLYNVSPSFSPDLFHFFQ
jgi:hypothetical protein